MKKVGVCLLVCWLFYPTRGSAQEPPPLYEEEAKESEPADLAIEKKPAVPAAKPAKPKTKTTEPAATPAAPSTPPSAPPVAAPPATPLPAATQPPAAPPAAPPPPPPAIEPAPKVPEIPVPANVPLVKVETEAATQLPPDGGPLRDAGSTLTDALTITYGSYKENTLSSGDTADMFKIYTRGGEGIGVTLHPQHPAAQLSCDILNETGELLSQLKAETPGQPLAFQTSPAAANGILYFRVQDLNIVTESPVQELRTYLLELKPAAAGPAVAAPAMETPGEAPALETPQPGTATAEREKPAPPAKPKKEKTKETSLPPADEMPWLLYGLIGVGGLVVLLVLMILYRRRRHDAF